MLVTASFLAGSVISLLFPTLLLIALVAWYVLAFRRVPEEPLDPPRPAPIEDPEVQSRAAGNEP